MNNRADAFDNKDTTARLLSWINRVQLDAAPAPDEVASEIADGLCEFADCHYAAILILPSPEDGLVLLAESGATPESEPDDATPPARFAVPHLSTVLPETPFFVAGAAPPLQVFVGEVSDFVRANTRLTERGAAQHITGAPLLAAPLRSPNVAGFVDVIGLALLWNSDQTRATEKDLLAALEAVTTQAGGWLSGVLRMERLSRSYRALAGVFADAVDSRSSGNSEPSRSVSYYAGLIARELALPPLHVARIELAGLLHHIGKVRVPDTILQRQAPLTPAERELVRASIVAGAQWLGTVEGLQEVAAMVRHQGENFDGSGYPDQLIGVEIPVAARILAVARRFTAMTSRRAERHPLSVVGGALESVTEEAGKAFDPRVVNAFLAALGRTV